MKVAVAQITCALGDVSANVRKLSGYCSRAKDAGADLIVFPEMVDTGYSMPVIGASALPWSEGAVPELREIAKRLSLGIICGVSERDGDRIYNAQVFVNASGAIAAKYRKTHLFTPAPIEEDKCFTCGDELGACEFDDLRLGLSICYDLRFPEVYRRLAVEEHANVLVISSAWPFPRVEHLRILATARAIENQSYVVLANRVGMDAGTTFCGTSAIIDPYGVVIAAASSDREEFIFGDISADVLQSVRGRMPVFEHRRPQLYR
ncbi:MAG TPA: nitrilase-related carbon-nitrogen hydrolase [Chthoniobacterales bacterium]|nr:nitrilase-related carbon-nitrogen hydrolase [Chthoniobacterales bacterium]